MQNGAAEFNLQKFYSAPQLVGVLLAGGGMSGAGRLSATQERYSRGIPLDDRYDDDSDDDNDEGGGESAAPELPFRPSPLEHRYINQQLNCSMILVGKLLVKTE